MEHSISISTVVIFLRLLEGSGAYLLQSVSGDVHTGNFTYLALVQPGFISLQLVSNKGDCDMYVSQFVDRPTYEDYSYCLQSSTCGLDTIIVPKSFKRPLAIGIYGHPSHEISSYTLNVYLLREESENGYETDDILTIHPDKSNIRAETEERIGKDGPKQDSITWVILSELFEFLIDMLLI